MNFLFRVLRTLFVGVGMFVLRIILRLLLVIILPLFIRLLSILFALMIFSIVSLAVGPRISVGRATELWTDRFMKIGIPPEYKDSVNSLVIFVTWLALFSGWTFTVLFLYSLFRVVFAFFT